MVRRRVMARTAAVTSTENASALHGMDVQVIARPDGTPLWFSRATPGRAHELTAARAHGIVQACLTRQIFVVTDRAYQGAGATFRTPYYVQPTRTQLEPFTL